MPGRKTQGFLARDSNLGSPSHHLHITIGVETQDSRGRSITFFVPITASGDFDEIPAYYNTKLGIVSNPVLSGPFPKPALFYLSPNRMLQATAQKVQVSAFSSIAVMFRLIESGTSEIFDVERLVRKLCTVWVGRQKLNASVARFLIESLMKKSSQFSTYDDNRHSIGVDVKNRGVKGYSNSSAHIVKGSQSSHYSCLNQHDYSNFLMGKVKDFASLSNLKVVLASIDFIIDGRVTWVEIEGIPLKMWSENTFNRIASIWGTLLHVEDHDDKCYHRKRICINTNVKSNIFESFKAIYQEESNGEDVDYKKFSASEGDNENEVVPDSMFEDELHEIDGEEVYVGQNKANSEDPFNLYDLLNKKKDENNKGDCVEDSLKFPPGFTPKDSNEVTEERPNMSNESKRVSEEGVHSFQEEDTGVKKYGSKKKAKDDVVESMCPGHFQKPETPWSGGSILQSMDDMVKNWNGEVIIMGDFNEVRKKAEGFGSVFNVQGPDAFNLFISNAGLEEVPLAVSLDRYLSHHRSILMRESYYDYGPVPFRFFHYWFDMEGFDKLVEESWKAAPVADTNAIIKMMKKLKYLKENIHV
ncbi:hypothetical protein Tco_0807165 [Tanacetum coccineum]